MLKALRPRFGSPVLFAIALLAIALRAVVPAGYMLSASDAGRIVVALCTGHGPQTTTMALGAPQKPSGDSRRFEQPCAYAMAAEVAPPAATPVVVAAAREAMSVAVASVAVAPGRGLAAPPPWPTGPPVAA